MVKFVVKCPKCGHVFEVETVFNLRMSKDEPWIAKIKSKSGRGDC